MEVVTGGLPQEPGVFWISQELGESGTAKTVLARATHIALQTCMSDVMSTTSLFYTVYVSGPHHPHYIAIGKALLKARTGWMFAASKTCFKVIWAPD